MFKGNKISLRLIEPQDFDLLLSVENDVENWAVSNTHTPFSRKVMREYVNSIQDITVQKQLRLAIEANGQVVGFIDLFEYDVIHSRCGVGILIFKAHRRKGLASEAVTLVEKYSREILHLHQLWCTISASNEISRKLFEKNGFVLTSTKKEWLMTAEGWSDEWFLQKFLD